MENNKLEQVKRKQSPALGKIMNNLTEERLAKTKAEMETLEQVAQEAALKAYPVCRVWKEDMSGGEEVDVNESDRLAYEEGFIAGWKAKEKDELTVEDIKQIDNILAELSATFNLYTGKYKKSDKFYPEVLKRFKEYKEKKKE